MGKWERVTVEDPIFTKGPKKELFLLIDGEWMAQKRYISPTEIWVGRMGPRDQFTLRHEKRSTPFVKYLKRGRDVRSI